LIGEVLDAVLEHTGSDVVTLLQYDTERAALGRVAHRSRPGAPDVGAEEPDEGQALVVQQGTPLLVADLRRHAAFRNSALARAGMRSALVGICERDGQPWGLVRVLAARTGAFSDGDLSFVRSVTHLLAIVRARAADGARA
jgi:GAF domain-containing protein